MRRPISAWLLRLALASSGLGACNALTGANDLVIDGGESGAPGGEGEAGGDRGGGSGGGSSADGAGGSGGVSSGGGGGSFGKSVTCGTTNMTGDDCRRCCAEQDRGLDESLLPEQVEAITGCLCDGQSSSGGLSDLCQSCRDGICAGRENADRSFGGDCSVCLKDGITCPALGVTCRNRPKACDALVSCFHSCQAFD